MIRETKATSTSHVPGRTKAFESDSKFPNAERTHVDGPASSIAAHAAQLCLSFV